MVQARWRLQLFGRLRATSGERVVDRFRTEKTGILLAYLACYGDRPHSREELTALLWPDSDEAHGRVSLRTALASLRRQLEPPGTPAGTVVTAEGDTLRLNSLSCMTDVAEFKGALEAAARAENLTDRAEHFDRALDLYKGPLLAEFYEDWVCSERARHADSYLNALRQMVRHCVQTKDLSAALDYAARAVQSDPLREESHRDLMQLYVSVGRASTAIRHYQELVALFEKEIGCKPSPATQRLAAEIQAKLADSPIAVPQPPKSRPVDTPGPALRAASVRRLPQLSSRPAGTVTFLFTDVEGSTGLLTRARDPFKQAMAKYHQILRDEFASHGGFEAKEAGDSFIVAFASAADALSCAIASQKAISTVSWPGEIGPLKVRMALQTGDVELEKGRYSGPALSRAARLLSAAHGGQILCSETTASVLRRDLQPGIQLLDLGIYRLRHLPSPERLFQVSYSEIADERFPAPRAEAGYAGNIPVQHTRFFGRESEIERLVEFLAPRKSERGEIAPRLYSITGPGGTGKTRLAIEVANRLVGAYNGAVWFVPLADCRDARLISGAIIDAMRLPRTPGQDALDQAIEALNRQPSLLVLDNFEQLVEDGASIVRTLLDRAEGVRCLVTTRRLLWLTAEREFPLQSLSVPPAPDLPDRLSSYEAVRLFVDRAQMAKPDFQLTPRNAATIAELCIGLDGIPLAIELAAARAQTITPAQMVEQLKDRFGFLVSRRRDVEERHRSLRDAIYWSYGLLPADLQRLFARLSVFRGGWTIESATEVCSFPDEPEYTDYADALIQLRDCSLVLTEESAAEMRFRMLETLREFGTAVYPEDEREELKRRHAAYFTELAEQSMPELIGPDQESWLARLESEHDNLRAALEWSCRSREEANNRQAATHLYGLRIAASLWRFWQMHGYFREGREWIEKALSQSDSAEGGREAATLRSKALDGAGIMAYEQSDYAAARKFFEEALAIRRQLGDLRAIASSLGHLGSVAYEQGDYPVARALHEQSLAIRRELDDRYGIALSLNNLGLDVFEQGDYPAARAFHEESLAIRRALGDTRSIAYSLGRLGEITHTEGNDPAALALYNESLDMMRGVGDRGGIAWLLGSLGLVAYERGDYAEALARQRESLVIGSETGDRWGIVRSLERIAETIAVMESPERAALIWGAAERLRSEIGQPQTPAEKPRYERHVADARSLSPKPEAFDLDWKKGGDMPLEHVIELALDSAA